MSNKDEMLMRLFGGLKEFSADKEKYISEIINNAIVVLNKNNEKLDKQKLKFLANYIKWILEELYKDYLERSGSKKNIAEDIEYIGSGFTCIAFRVGDNVIKLGESDYALLPIKLDSKYQVPTYIRESYEIGDKIHFRLEIAPYVDTRDIAYEDVYKAYSNIRSLGYIWNDPKEENIGRIINASGCKIGGKRYFPKQQYKKGDLVLIDLDDIAYVGEETSDIILDEISSMSYNKNVYIFETRYMEEKRRKITGRKKSEDDDMER